nr:transposase [Salinibacter ruber]
MPPIGSLRSATAPRNVSPFTARELHLVVEHRSEQLPVPERAGLTPGSENDLRALRRVLSTIEGGVLCGDKAYCDGPLKERLAKDQDLDLLTPVKKEKGQKTLSAADRLYSEAVSRLRQPIESLFNWINEKTGIQQASKVRSYRGLLVYAFGRLAAAMLLCSQPLIRIIRPAETNHGPGRYILLVVKNNTFCKIELPNANLYAHDSGPDDNSEADSGGSWSPARRSR